MLGEQGLREEVRRRILHKTGHIDEDAFALWWADKDVQEQVCYHTGESNLPDEDWNWYVQQYERFRKMCLAYHQMQVEKAPREVVHGNMRLYEARQRDAEPFLPEVTFTERDRLIMELMRETATYFAERVPEVRRVRQLLQTGEPLTPEELGSLEQYLTAWGRTPSVLNTVPIWDTAGIGLAPFLRNGERYEVSPAPLPRSVGEVFLIALTGVTHCVHSAFPMTEPAHWLIWGEWFESWQEGHCVLPSHWQSHRVCIPLHLDPRTVRAVYHRLSVRSVLLARHAQRPVRVKRPSERAIKRAVNIVRGLRRGLSWREIATEQGMTHPSDAQRALTRVWQSLGVEPPQTPQIAEVKVVVKVVKREVTTHGETSREQ